MNEYSSADWPKLLREYQRRARGDARGSNMTSAHNEPLEF